MTGDAPRARILAVDDERQILRALRVILRSEGYDVLTAATVKEALDQAATSHIDAAVVDLLLPDGDGIELTTQLRTRSAMPVIMLSAVGEEEQKIRALRAGADDYITKPFGPGELVARIEAVLRRASPEPDSGSGTVSAAGLTARGSRLSLAAALVSMLGAADERRADRASVLILDHEAVLRERDQIEQLIVRLRSGETVRARGVALVRLLVRDSRGPLYHHRDGQTLHDALATIARAL